MTIKRILVPFPSSVEHSAEIDTALSAAKALGAHVETLFIKQPAPATRGGVTTAEIGYYTTGSAALARVNWHAAEEEKRAHEAHDRLARACAAAGIPLLTADEQPTSLPAATWREAEGAYVEVAVHRAAAFDLVVAASANVMESLKIIAEQSLLQTRRPVLLAASAQQETSLTESAMIAWDESPECWHAVSAALPFLRLARSVQVISIDRNAENRRASQNEVLAYLRAHGIEAKAEVVAPHLRSVGDALLAVAGEHGSGLLVMGAYSHSRLREMLLGGATRHILQNAVARPVLLAH